MPSAYAPSLGGVEELTSRLARRLVDAGDDVEIWTVRYRPELPAHERVDAITVHRFELPLPRLSPLPLLRFPYERRRALRALRDAAGAFRPDLVHVQCFSANGVYARSLARRLGCGLVVTLQGETVMDDQDIYEHSTTLRLALRQAMRSADAVTGCSRFVLADAERRFGLPSGSGHVIPNGVELEERVTPQRLELPFDRFVLGLGRIVEKKGFDLLLEAFALLADRHPDVGLVIGGDGPRRPEIMQRIVAAGLEARAVAPGRLGRDHVAWAMSAADVFVLPSRVEPFGIVVLEALRAGCPAIVSPYGGATEIVRDGVDGLVVDPHDPARLADAISRVLTDAELADQLRGAGRARATAFDWKHVARSYRTLYEQILAGQNHDER